MEQEQTSTSLQRKLGLFPVTNIVIANMIGAGIFTTSGLLMQDLGNPLLMLGLWVIGGIIALCGALVYSELGAAIPQAGGEYVFLSRLYHPLFGFLSGWVSFIVGFSAPIAASSIGFSEYFFRAFPQLLEWSSSTGILNPDIIKNLFSILIITVFTLIHIRGIEFGTKIQNVLTILKVGLIIGLLGIGFTLGKGDFNHFYQSGSFTFNFGGWKTISLSLMWIMFAYSGWNASTYIGSEIKNPVKNLPLSLLYGTGIVLALYIGLNILFVYAVNPAEMKGVISIGGLAAGHLFGRTVEQLFSVLISFALFSSLSAFIILGPRVYYAMARDGYFFKFAAQVHTKFKVPVKAVLLQGAISIIMVLFGTFDQILTYMGFSLGIFPILAVLGVFKLRKSKKNVNRMPGYPLAPVIYVVIWVFMLTLAYFERPVESSIAVVTVLIGLPAFWLFERQNESTGQ